MSHKLLGVGESRLIAGLGHFSYKVAQSKIMIITILVPPLDNEDPHHISSVIFDLMQDLYGDPVKFDDRTQHWSWNPRMFYININIDFDQEIENPERFAYSQLMLIRWKWSMALVRKELKVYLQYLAHYPEDQIDDQIEELLNEELVRELRRYDWVTLIPASTNLSNWFPYKLSVGRFGDTDQLLHFAMPCKSFELGFWNYIATPEDYC